MSNHIDEPVRDEYAAAIEAQTELLRRIARALDRLERNVERGTRKAVKR